MRTTTLTLLVVWVIVLGGCCHGVHGVDVLDALVDVLHESCQGECMPVLKSAKTCESFCRFAQHIQREHGKQLTSLVAVHDYEPIQAAMRDVVLWRRRTANDDDGAASDVFMERLHFWVDALSGHTDL